MITKKFILIFLLQILLCSVINAQNGGTGNTGAAFLKLGAGARSIGMGEAFSSVTDDATCLIYNPARLNFGLKSNVALMHNSLVQDMSTDFIALKFPVSDKVSMGLGLFTTYISGIEIRNIPGASIGEFDSRNMSLGLSFGYKINPSLSLGLTTKYLFEKIYVDEASGFAFDFGSNYTKKNLSLALVVSNVGSLSALRNQKTVLPTSLRLGGSYKISKDKFSFIIGIDGYKVIDGGSFHVNTGGEAGYKDFVFLRLGYQTEYENKGFTSGLGFKYKSVSFDYAFVPYNNNFGNSNTFSLGLNF